MSNGNVIGWTIFLWAIFFRLVTVRLVTEVRDGQLVISLRGFWRSRRIRLSEIQSAEPISFDAIRDYGGYGIRTGLLAKHISPLVHRVCRQTAESESEDSVAP